MSRAKNELRDLKETDTKTTKEVKKNLKILRSNMG